jgi:hypothetical protein
VAAGKHAVKPGAPASQAKSVASTKKSSGRK